MIELRPYGILPEDLDTIVGRIVMVDGMTQFDTYNDPARVMSVSKKTMVVVGLKRSYDAEINRMVYRDDAEEERGRPLQLRTAKIICDTADEVNAVRALGEKLGNEFAAFIKSAPSRYQELVDELAPTPTGP